MARSLKHAVSMAFLAFFISLPILGIHIDQSAQGLSLKGQWRYSAYAAVAVFLIQLIVPMREKVRRISLRGNPFAGMERHRNRVLAVLIVIGMVIPFVASRGTLDIATLALIYVMLGLGLNVVVGFAGLLDLGYVGFYAIGAYTYAILQQYGYGFWGCLAIAAGLSALLGILLGFPVLRLRGDYLAIVTLGFGEIIRILLNNLDAYTNGPAGIGSIPAPSFFHIVFTKRAPEGMVPFHQLFGLEYSSHYRMVFVYFVIFFLCLSTLWIIDRLVRMPIGRAWEALREDEIACRSLGINPTMVKLTAFATGAFFAGIAGAFFAAKQGFVNPESFTFIESAIILSIVVLGGMGSQTGVILAAIALTVIPEIAREFSQYRMLIFGAVMVMMMIWRPQGLMPAQRPKLELP